MKKQIITLFAIAIISIAALSTTAFADAYTDNTVLYSGMKNENVSILQKDLKSLGYYNYTTTGYFGSITKESVVRFQQANSLVADGIVGRATAREIKVDRIIQTGKQYLGVPYVWGGASPSGFDCSGFIEYTFLNNGINIPRTAELQYNQGTWVSRNQLKPGDLVFFTTYKPGPSHVGIYLGNNQFIHASSGAGKITVSDLTNSYYAGHYIGAKRILQ